MDELLIEAVKSAGTVGIMAVWLIAERNAHRADLVYYRDQLNASVDKLQTDVAIILSKSVD